DIAAHGQREPIVMFEDMILDGYNRYRACRQLGIEPTFTVYTGDDPVGFAVSLNLHRRHLNESQRAWVAAKLVTMKRGDNQHSEGMPIGRASDLLNIGGRSVARACEVRDHGVPELGQALARGGVSVSAAAEVASLPESEQREVLADGGAKAVAAKARERREERAAAAAERKWDITERDDDDEEEPEDEAEEPEDEAEAEPEAEPEPAKVDWRSWSRTLGADRTKQIRGTCLATNKELAALRRLTWGVQKKLIADAASGKTVSAAAIWEGLKTTAKDITANLISRDLDDARRLRDTLLNNGDGYVRDVFINALSDGIDELDGI